MSLPEISSLAHSGWRQSTRVAEHFSQNQRVVFPARLECFPCSRKKRSKLWNIEVSVSGSNSSPFCLRIVATKCASEIVEFTRWYQLSVVLTCLHSFGPSLKSQLSSFLRFPFLFYKCVNVSIVKFSVNLVFQLAFFSCNFQLFQFRTASLQRLQVIILKDYHLKVRLVLVCRRQRMKDSSRRPF